MPSVEWDRVNKTNPSPYDQIFILSEDVINKSFEDLFVNHPDVIRRDQEAVQTRGRSGQYFKNAKAKAPLISLHVEERNPAYLALLTLRFHQGEINLRTTPAWKQPPIFRRYDVTEWQPFKMGVSRLSALATPPFAQRQSMFKTTGFMVRETPGNRFVISKTLWQSSSALDSGAFRTSSRRSRKSCTSCFFPAAKRRTNDDDSGCGGGHDEGDVHGDSASATGEVQDPERQPLLG
ncbi:hypothetical protein BJY04DRAFT_194590 [Aspergillus karnatakaensis]|uniref:uncharacterized protein n=1 Tax=Aspergillus karnatakaensis TaxID=1810916 RepID=UPI003CCDEBD4